MWPPGHSGYCSLLRAAVAAICHETRPGETLQYPGCTAPFKITQEGAGAERGREGGRRGEGGDGGGGGGGGERDARCCRWPLVVTEDRTIEDDTWQTRKAARKAKIRQRGGTNNANTPSRTHSGFISPHSDRKTAQPAYS